MMRSNHILFSCLVLLLTACSGQINPETPEIIVPEESSLAEEFFQNQPAIVNPAKVAIAIDFSGSRETSRIGQITLEDFASVIKVISAQGGEIGVISICSDSNLPALRIKVEPPPYLDPRNFNSINKPVQPDTEGISPFAAMEQMQEYQQQEAQYKKFAAEVEKTISLHQQELQQWQVLTSKNLDRFKSQLQALLEQPANCPNSDIWGAIARIDLFLNEDSSTWNLQPHNFAVLITDGEHNTEHQPFQMQSRAEILLVNGAVKTGVIQDLDHKAFEAPAAAFEYLVQTLTQQEVANDK